MTAKKNPFADWQRSVQERRESLLREYLVSLRKSRVRFKFVTDLAGMAAAHLSEKEARPCNQATLLRNTRYKQLLLSFMAARTRPGTDAIDESTIRDPKAKAVLDTTAYSMENLRRENERLKAYLAELSGRRSLPSTASAASEGNRKTSSAKGVSEDRANYVATCRLLLAVLRKFDGIVRIDEVQDRIVDLTESPPRVLVSGSEAKPFFDWYRHNR